MIHVEDALRLVKTHVTPNHNTELKSIKNSVGHVLSEDIISPINMPPFRQSAMDGYAIHIHNDLTYRLIGEVKAGDDHHPTLEQGEAVRIFTGAPVPDTANSVVIQEKVIKENKKIILEDSSRLDDNIRPMGEQVMNGDTALKKGTKLTPPAIGYLISLGITNVRVYSKPKIAIVVTGNELIEAGHPLPYGKIYESNSSMLQSTLNHLGFENVTTHKVNDDYVNTLSILDDLIEQKDMVLISGGISVGDYDFVGKALNELNVHKVFYKVNQKPGKPLFFGKRNNSCVFALPGNPASALTCFYIYVQPSLDLISGMEETKLVRTLAKSNSDFTKKGVRAQFLKASVNNGHVDILEGQSSAMLQTFALANALVFVPGEKCEISKGEMLEVIPLPV